MKMMASGTGDATANAGLSLQLYLRRDRHLDQD